MPVCDFNSYSSVWGLEIIPHPWSLSIGGSLSNLGDHCLTDHDNIGPLGFMVLVLVITV